MDPNYKNPTSIWDWALQFPAVAPPVVAPPPPVIIPPAKTIKSILITYSDGSTETRP